MKQNCSSTTTTASGGILIILLSPRAMFAIRPPAATLHTWHCTCPSAAPSCLQPSWLCAPKALLPHSGGRTTHQRLCIATYHARTHPPNHPTPHLPTTNFTGGPTKPTLSLPSQRGAATHTVLRMSSFVPLPAMAAGWSSKTNRQCVRKQRVLRPATTKVQPQATETARPVACCAPAGPTAAAAAALRTLRLS